MLSLIGSIRVVAAGAALVGALAACGDGNEDESEDLSPFCQEVREIGEEYASDDAAAGEALENLEASVPEEIAEHWEVIVEHWDELINGVEADDAPADDETEPDDETETDPLEELNLSWRIVRSYLEDVCSIEM